MTKNVKKATGSGYVALYNDAYERVRRIEPASSLEDWQIKAIDYCLDRMETKHELEVKVLRLRYGLEKDDISTGKTYKECEHETGSKCARDNVIKGLQLLHYPVYSRAITEKGYLELYLAVEEEKAARDKRDRLFGEQISTEFNLFKDVRGYINFNRDLGFEKYRVSLDGKAIRCLKSAHINTFNDLVASEEKIKDDKIFGLGPIRKQEVLDFIKELKDYDAWFNNEQLMLQKLAV